MAGIKACKLVGTEFLKSINGKIVSQLKSGMKDPNQMIGEFWQGLNNQEKLNHPTKILLLNSYLKFLPVLLVKMRQSNDPAVSSLIDGFNVDPILKTYDRINDASDIDEFIQETFINPYLPESLQKTDPEVVTEGKEKEDLNKTTSLEEDPTIANDPVIEEEAEKAVQKALTEDIFEEIEEDENVLGVEIDKVGTSEAEISVLLDRAQKRKHLILDHKGQMRVFTYNKEKGTFSELSPDLERKAIETNAYTVPAFIAEFQGARLMHNHVYTEYLEQQKSDNNESLKVWFMDIAKRFAETKLATVFGNAINAAQRESSKWFSMDEKGKLVPGEIAETMNYKNKKFSIVYDKMQGFRSEFTLDQNSIDLLIGRRTKGNRLFLEKNSDPSLNNAQLVLTIKDKDGKEIINLGNFFDTEFVQMFGKVDNGNDYLNFIRDYADRLNEPLDVTDRGIKITKVFQPNFKNAEENKIYEDDKNRFGRDQDSTKAVKLTLGNARILMEAMGFGVSQPYVDKGLTGSNLLGKAFIAVSPLKTKGQIEGIIKKAYGENRSEKTMAELNKEHNITFLFLNGKDLQFNDYLEMTKNNVSAYSFRDNDVLSEDERKDHGKRQGMFSLGQSAYLHYRLAKSIAFMQAYADKTKQPNDQAKVELLKLFIFNGLDRFGENSKTDPELKEFKEAYKISYDSGVLTIPQKFIVRTQDNYKKWLELENTQDQNGEPGQLADSKRIANRLFGYIPRRDGKPASLAMIARKEAWAKDESEIIQNQNMKRGGIFGAPVFSAFDVFRRPDFSKVKVNGKTLQEVWNNKDIEIGTELTAEGAVSQSTFNPVVTNKFIKDGYIGKSVSTLSPLKSEFDGDNKIDDYLELEYLPQMPHLEVDVSGLLPENLNSEEVEKNRLRIEHQKARRISNKAVDPEELSEIDYNLNEQEAIDLYGELLGDIQGELVLMDSPIVLKDGIIIGQVSKDVLKLHRMNGMVSEAVLRHEIWHRLVNEVLSSDSRQKLYREAKKAMLTENSLYNSIDSISDIAADEWLSEKYEKNHRSHGDRIARNLPRIVRDLYFFVRSVFNALSNKSSYFDLIADKLESGVYVNAALQHNAYQELQANKKIRINNRKIALEIHADLGTGAAIMQEITRDFVTHVQNEIYGEKALLNPVPVSYSDAALKIKNKNFFFLQEDLNKETSILNEKERILFMAGVQSISQESDIQEVAKNLPGIATIYNDLSEDAQFVFKTLHAVIHHDSFAKMALPFVELSSQEQNNEAGAETTADEQQLESDQDVVEIVSSGARHLFERSEMSSYGTFSEKVKFFLYNTKENNDTSYRRLVDRVYVDKYFELVFETLSESTEVDQNGDYTVQDLILAAKRQRDSLASHTDSAQYRSVNGIYNRFFDPANPYSFYSIAMNTDPKMKAQAREHTSVLVSILSAQKSVIQQGFLKSSNYGITSTKTDGRKEFKNTIKDGIVGKLFQVKKENNNTFHVLSDHAKEKFFSNNTYSLFNTAEGLQINIGGNHVTLTQSDLIRNSGNFDLSDEFVSRATKVFKNNVDLFVMMKDLGINISKQFFYAHINSDKSTKSPKLKSLVKLAMHSYLILAKQHIEEGYDNPYNEQSLSIINNAAARRNEDIKKITNSDVRRDELTESGESETRMAYTPTALWEKFEALAGESVLSRYEKGNPLVYIMDGSKEVIDKYPNTMHRVLGKLKNTKLKIEANLKRINEFVEEDNLKLDAENYLKRMFPATYSNMYKNPVVSGDLELGSPEYYKGTKNNKTNRSREYLKMTEVEFMTELLNMLSGKDFKSSYHHMHEIQADRSFGIFSMLGDPASSKNRFHPVRENGKLRPVKSGSLDLEHIRRIPYHHAGNIMKEVYTILGDTKMVDAINSKMEAIDLTGIKKEFMNLEKRINEEYEKDPYLINHLTNQKHFLKVGNKLQVSPLLKEQMTVSEKGFEKEIENEYVNFVEYLYGIYNDKDLNREARFNLNWNQIKGVSVLEDKNFKGKSFNGQPSVKLFLHEKINSVEYQNMSAEEKVELYHPALYSMFLTYFINQTHIAQRLTGGLHLYRADKNTGPRTAHSYITDNVKRQGTFTTPKIDPVYREVLPDGSIFNREGMDRKITVAYIPDMVYNSTVDNKPFHDIYEKANKELVEKMKSEGKKINFEQETTDGGIYASQIFLKKLRASYGGENGMSVNTLIKSNLHSFDPSTGDLHLPKGLTQIITPEVLEVSEKNYLGMLKMMYRTAMIVAPEGTQSLWAHFEGALASGMDVFQADEFVTDLYFKARNNEEGHSMVGDIVDMLVPPSTNKGAGVGLNPYDSSGEPLMEETVYSTVSTDGLGVILDLQKDINKDNLEITLSSQMLFLLGINGDNHLDSTALYEMIKVMSSSEMDNIASDIARTFGKGTDSENVLGNKAAIKKWMVKEIKNSYAAKSDFGLIYKLMEDFNSASISNPIVFEEIYSKVGSRISKAIVPKMNGFKAVQIPAHNFIKLYIDPVSGKQVMKNDLIRKGIDPASVESVNLKYSNVDKNTLTDTEVFTGNIFTGKYGLDERLSLDQIFSINAGGQEINLEATSYDKIQFGNPFQQLRDALNNDLPVDWISSPIISNMLERGEFTKETAEKIMSGELSRVDHSMILNMLMARTKAMNKMLYGAITRIPGTGKNSSSPTRIRGFVSGYKNAIFTPAEWFIISGSDNDGDTVQFWSYDTGTNEINNKSLDLTRKILKDPKNAMEMFSGINLDYFNDLAAKGKNEMVKNGKGYFHGSLRTVSLIRKNNATGAVLTGMNATQSKVHSYTTVAKSIIDYLISLNQDLRRDKRFARFQGERSGIFTDKETGTAFNSGVLFKNEQGIYVDEKGEFVYKWNEKITNGAIDNPKHLTMNFTGMTSYNSGLQQAMTFFGTSKENIIKALANPFVQEVYKKVEVKDNIAEAFTGKVKKAMQLLDADGLALSPFGELKNISKSTFENYFGNPEKNWQIDFNNKTDVYGFILYMELAAEEINNIRKVIKVTEQVPGRSGKQENMMEGLLEAVNTGFQGTNEFVDAGSLLRFIDTLENKEIFDHVSKTRNTLTINPLHNKRIMDALEKSIVMHPLALIATIPHIREFTKRHLEFQLMKEGHILSDEKVKNLKNELAAYIDVTQLRVDRNRVLINKAFYKFIDSVYLEKFPDYAFDGQKFNLGTIKGKKEFRKKLAEHIDSLKTDTDNLFLRRLDIEGDEISFPGSEKMDNISRIVPEEHFSKLDPKLQQALLLYEMTGSDTHLQYKKGSFIAFMNAFVFEDYHAFLRGLESDKNLFRNNDDAKAFLRSFAFENPSIISKTYARSVIGREEYGFLTDTRPDVKKKKKFNLKAENVRDFEFGMFNQERITKIDGYKKTIEEGLQKMKELQTEYNTISENEILDLSQKIRLNKIKDILYAISKQINEFQAKINAAMIKPVNSEGTSKFKLIKGYDKKESKVTKRLFEVSKVDDDVIMEEVHYPFDTKINYYSRAGQLPKVTNEKFMVDSVADLGKMIKEGKAENGTYYAAKDATQYVVEDGKVINKVQYHIPDSKASVSARKKSKAIAQVVSAAFPKIKVHYVSGMTGEFQDAAGYVHQNEVYLNLDNLHPETPVHEFGHIFVDLLEKSDPVLFARIESMVRKTELFSSISEKYAKFGNTDLDNIKETFTTMLGMHLKEQFSIQSESLTANDKRWFPELVKTFNEFIRKMVREGLKSLGIHSSRINNTLIDNMNLGSDLTDLFHAFGGAVLEGKVITDLSTKELNELEGRYGKQRKTSDSEVQRIINILTEKEIILNYC